MSIIDDLLDRRQKGIVTVKEGNVYRDCPARLHTTVNVKTDDDGNEIQTVVTQWDYQINGVKTTVIQPEQIGDRVIMPEYKKGKDGRNCRVIFVQNGRLIASPGAGVDGYNISASRVAYLTRSAFLSDLSKSFRVRTENTKSIVMIIGVIAIGILTYFVMSGGMLNNNNDTIIDNESTTTAITTGIGGE